MHLRLVVTVCLLAATASLAVDREKGKVKARDMVFPVHPELHLQIDFLDHPLLIAGQEDKKLGPACMRFGIFMPNVPDPTIPPRPENPAKKKCLCFFPEGTSNNTVLRIDGDEYEYGSPPKGMWTKRESALGKTGSGRVRAGKKSVYFYPDEKIQVTQIVEVVPSDQPRDVEYQQKKQQMRLLDTVLIRYEIENQDSKPHQVGLRFLLDTFIGSNDGVPFLIPGKAALCDTMLDMVGTKTIPDFIEALENPRLDNPGTIAKISLRVKGLEVPSRVTLGAWPHHSFSQQEPKARGHHTLWEVPLLSMKAGNRSDSAVTIYWNENVLKPKEKRIVGFAYGLGNVAAAKTDGKLGLTAGGKFEKGATFTLTALVKEPEKGDTLTLQLPKGFELVDGDMTQQVPPLPANATTKFSPVSWKIKALVATTGKFVVKRGNGGSQTLFLAIKGAAQPITKKKK
jgi:hypothetical protein